MWFESKNPVTQKAQKHFEVSLKRQFDKEGFNNNISIVPNKLVTLNLDIPDKEFIKFIEICKNFSDGHSSSLKIMNDEHTTTIEIPKNNLFEFARELEKNKSFDLDENEISQIKKIIEDKE